MNEVQIFSFKSNEIRSLMINDEPWFVGKDVAEVLGYSEPHKAISRHVDEDDGTKRPVTDNLGRTQEMTIINESGLYSLILSSKLPQAKEFKRWVTGEVLPTIRKTGSYNGLSYDNKIEIATLITKCRNVKSVEALISLFEIKAPIIVKDKEIKGSKAKGVRAYLDDIEKWELTNTNTKTVHSDYKSFCKDNNFVALSLNEFSKEIRRQTGAVVKRHRVGGKLTGFYEFE